MKLSDFEIVEGVIVDANDPKHLGRVKGVAPGMFDNSTMNIGDMFWIYPFSSPGYQRASKPQQGQKIWILHNQANEYAYWYIPMAELNINTTATVQGDDYDVMVSRTGQGIGSQMYYNGDEGFVTRTGTTASTTMSPSGDITNISNKSQVSMKGGLVYVGGEEGNNHSMVLGDKLVELLKGLQTNISNLALKASSTWTTSHLAGDLNKMASDLQDAIQPILTSKAFIVDD